MMTAQARKLLGVTSTTLNLWCEKGYLKFKTNELGWKIFDEKEILKFKKNSVIQGRKSGRKLKASGN